MRSIIKSLSPSELYFAGGIAVGLVFAGVTLVTIDAARRASKRRLIAQDNKMPVIDGVRPVNPAILASRPVAESSSSDVHLASEAPDVPPLSQRW